MKAEFSQPSLGTYVELVRAEYGLDGEIKPLSGENENYLVSLADGRRYVLKRITERISSEVLEMERQIVAHLQAAGVKLDLPREISTRSGAEEASYRTQDGNTLRARLFEFVSGTPWIAAGVPGDDQLRNLGAVLAEVDLALAAFEHPLARRTHPWDLTRAAQHRSRIDLIHDPNRRRIVEWMFHFYAACTGPRLADLPQSIIHGDVNDENLMLRNGRISGLLDFSDALRNPTVDELAIAMAYAVLDRPDPLLAGAEIIGGYHSIRPLLESEIGVLFPLICGRLCTSVLIAAERRRIDPDRSSWFTTEARAWDLMERLYTIDPAEAEERLTSTIDVHPLRNPGASKQELLGKRSRYISPALSIAYRHPHKLIRGEGQYLFDRRGRPFLDLVNNVCHVGHCHPRVVEAGQNQMAQLNTNTRYLYDGLTDYAARLCATLPDSLTTVFMLNSGSEANELALRLAMAHTGAMDFLVVEGAYHGHTANLISLSPYKFRGPGGCGRTESWVHVVPMPDGYRGTHKGCGREAGVAYGDEVGTVIQDADAPIAGFLVEPLMSCGGQIVPPDGYLERAFRHVREAGGVCIADEVQTGFGRAGSHFWAFELQDVVPDIVVMGKPIGNGHPMAAVVTTEEIAASFANGMEFFSTFGGNPVSCAIGLAVLDVIRDEKLQQRAFELGERFQEGLRRLVPKHALVGDVRGAGLFLGIELVRDRETLEPAAEEAYELVQRLNERGILLSTDGPFHNVIKIKPPMVLTADDVDMTLRCIDDELAGIA
jgi:4-aminobutyrate aminotransferase-like enzyme/Ser/Thr protein kinase RdoA (MazF antagonist)